MEETQEEKPNETDLHGVDQHILELVEKQVGPLGIEFILKYVPDNHCLYISHPNILMTYLLIYHKVSVLYLHGYALVPNLVKKISFLL